MGNMASRSILTPSGYLFFQNSRDSFENKEAFDFCVGSIMGDASIHVSRGQLVFDQKQRAFTEWKHKKAVEYSIATPRSTVTMAKRVRVDKKTGVSTTTTSHRFWSRALFKEWRPFFLCRKKTFGSNVRKWELTVS